MPIIKDKQLLIAGVITLIGGLLLLYVFNVYKIEGFTYKTIILGIIALIFTLLGLYNIGNSEKRHSQGIFKKELLHL